MHIIPNLGPLPQIKSLLPYLIGLIGGIILIIISTSFYIQSAYKNNIMPGVSIGSIDVGRLSVDEAKEKVALSIRAYRHSWPLTFTYQTASIEIPLPDNAVSYNIDQSVNNAHSHLRHPLDVISLLVHITQKQQHTLELSTNIDDAWIASQSARIAQIIDQPTLEPTLEVINTATGPAIQINPGKPGTQFDQNSWENELKQSLITLQSPETQIYAATTYPSVSESQIQASYKKATTLLDRTLVLKLAVDQGAERSWLLKGEDVIRFINIKFGYDLPIIRNYIEGVAQSVNRPPKDAKFQFDETLNKVTEFTPAETGIAVDIDKTSSEIITAINQVVDDSTANTVNISIVSTQPSVSLNDANTLGIKEKIGVGTSTFKGSILPRVHNVVLGASRLNGTIIKPGEEFSFNQAVGEVSGATGYQQAYIIRNGRTELDDGGGICQVSTTIFRAALNAGLPISSRRGHAYRVGYYEQDTKPGIDATVFSPTTDFRFLNDTPGNILIQTVTDEAKRTLIIYIYGTSDGRIATIKDHEIWDVTPPPPDVWFDDPTLPTGIVKQVDWKAPGTKTKFTQHVERNGQVLFEKTFYTNYKPWANIFLRGTKQ